MRFPKLIGINIILFKWDLIKFKISLIPHLQSDTLLSTMAFIGSGEPGTFLQEALGGGRTSV